MPSSSELHAETTVVGESLLVRLTSAARCTTTETPYVHRVVHEKRTPAPSLAYYEFGGGAVLLGLGVYSFVDSQNLANSTGNTSGADPTSYQATGGLLAGLGLAAIAVGIVDTVRGMDRDRDEGLIALPARSTESVCHQKALAEARAQVVLRSGMEVPLTTDADGAAKLSMVDLAADDVPDSAGRATIACENRVARLYLDDGQRTDLLRVLRADPASRFAREAESAAKASCKQALAAARGEMSSLSGEDLASLSSSKGTWISAKATCGERWTAADESELEHARDALTDREAAVHHQACAEALAAATGALRKDDEDLLDNTSEGLKAACQGSKPDASAAEAMAARLRTRAQVVVQANARHRNQKLVKLWQSLTGRCARIQRDRAAFERVRSCDSRCQAAQSAIVRDWDDLASETLPPVPDDEAEGARVKALCERAGCPSCPE